MTEYLGVVIALVASRILTALIGLTFGYFGYRLFCLGVYVKAGELRAAWGERHLILKQAAPGTFFALFGTVITAAALLGGGDVERARTLTTSGTTKGSDHTEAVTPTKPEPPPPKPPHEEPRRPRAEKPIATHPAVIEQERITTHLNRPPTMGCQADPTTVYEDSGDLVTLNTNASSPDGDSLTYSWRTTAGNLIGAGPSVRWDSKGVKPGTYTVIVVADDERGGNASCSVSIRVEPKPKA